MVIRNLLIILSLCLPFSVIAEPPNFALPDLNGKFHHLADYRGKWVIVNYWATWCPPCLEEIPELVEFHDAHQARDAVVLGVNYEESDPIYLKSFVEENLISYPILRANLTRQPVFGRLYGLPTTYIISPTGELFQSKTGSITRAYIEAIIKTSKNADVVVTK